jgi:hypothetical protein
MIILLLFISLLTLNGTAFPQESGFFEGVGFATMIGGTTGARVVICTDPF